MENNEIQFEEALAKLEKIVSMMESGEAPLDKSLEMFEEGIKLVKICSERLDKAEQKVKILKGSSEGELKEEDLDV